MARPSSISALPPDIIEALRERLLDSGFTGYQGHSDWLAEKGYIVSKSTVIRWGHSIELGFKTDLRLSCATIAARYSTAETIIENSKELLRWIDPPRVPSR